MAANDDFTTYTVKQRLARLEAEELRLSAAYKEAEANGDYIAGEDLGQRIANVRMDAGAIINAYNQEVAKNTQQQQRVPTEQERLARAPDAMDGDDALLASNHGVKKGLELTADEYNEQLAKYHDLKARGVIR